MRVSTDDGRFGFIVASLSGPGMFRFQLIVDGRLIGDDEPCILGSAMYRLGRLKHLDDDRLRQLSEDRDAVFSALRTDELLHDAATLSLAESLDRWLIHGYLHEDGVTILAREYKSGELDGPILVSVLDVAEYSSLFDAARDYWLKAGGNSTT